MTTPFPPILFVVQVLPVILLMSLVTISLPSFVYRHDVEVRIVGDEAGAKCRFGGSLKVLDNIGQDADGLFIDGDKPDILIGGCDSNRNCRWG